MRSWLANWTPSPGITQKLGILAIIVGVGIGAFFWGKRQTVHANAEKNTLKDFTLSDGTLEERGRRVVAYLYDDLQVSRAELGEYLIARFGAERLEFMLNRKIVEIEARKFNIHVTDAEVEYRLKKELQGFGGSGLTEKDFENNVLRRYNKTMTEWKEDVLRPKIMMEKIVSSHVNITEADVREGFEARYGPMVECRMIVMEKGSPARQKIWEEARKGRDTFLAEANKQFIPNLAAAGGKIPPIHKHFPDKTLEEAAFRLKEGEVSGLLEMVDGSWVILYCEKQLPGDKSKSIDEERARISKEMHELRVSQRMPEVFAEMRKMANPRIQLVNGGQQSLASTMPLPQPSSVPLQPQAVVPPVKVPPAPVVPPDVKPGAGIGLSLPPLSVVPPPELAAPEKKD